ncbi:BRICHOS domain-containing protein 5 [Paramormyrops kingsleyae]|uniref:BRICHOS domain-containing protein 5 n=1 Tax=Paramormyrops kingsleyae TaxID=1676925 RepID=UPI000CD5CE87|nr:BRICHOS domain-containing protein 5 [Paramormyrops kingsleyae]
MVRCCTASRLEDSPCEDGSPALPIQFRHRALWGSLTAVLLLVIIVLSVTGRLAFRWPGPQVIRITALDGTGSLVNQSATVERRDSAVTYSVTSGGTNRTSTMLFDIRHGVICYKPDSQDTCFLRKMDSSDYENLQALLGDSTQKVSQFWFLGNETQRFTEFLEVLGGKPVDTASLPEPLQPLCLQSSTYWARKAAGPAKQRLIYFCIDICFPNNVCVSVCFYYLPE